MMGDPQDLDFYHQLWVRCVGEAFTSQKLAKRVRVDGGVDIEHLSNSDLLNLIEARFSGRWSDVAFTFSELLASYSVPGGIQTNEQVVGWVFASFVIADCIRTGAADWEMEFDKFMNGYLAVRNKLEQEDSVRIFQRVFCVSSGSVESSKI